MKTKGLLATYLTQHLETPFAWGVHDCVLFANKWVTLDSGVNHLEGFPSWNTERGAKRAIIKVGGLEKAIDARFTRINPNFAVDGDIALYDNRVCIFSGSKIVGPSDTGLIYTDRTLALCAWSY